MGNYFYKSPPPPMVLVPPLFDFPPLAARYRMIDSSYNVLFGKLALKCLFDEYFEKAGQFTTKIMLKSIDDPNIDMIAMVSGNKFDQEIITNAIFRWQRDPDDPNTFMDLYVSNSNPTTTEDFGILGLRYGSSNLSCGMIVKPFAAQDEMPKNAWLVTKMGRLTVGVQFDPNYEVGKNTKYNDMRNWSAAVGLDVGSGSPLSPSFSYSLELEKGSKFIASFYEHAAVQRRVKNPLEKNEIIGITNYIDFGFELQSGVDDSNNSDSTFRIGGSWQANKNILVKGYLGPLSTSLGVAFKSWWNPTFTFNVAVNWDRLTGMAAYGCGLRIENLREASYQRADPNYVMLTPSKQHLAQGIQWQVDKLPMLQSDLDAENFEAFPKELRPISNIL